MWAIRRRSRRLVLVVMVVSVMGAMGFRAGASVIGGAAVAPEIDAELRLVVSAYGSDHMSDANFASYNSITTADVDDTFYAEVWLRDIGTVRGISGGTVDITYTTAYANAVAVNNGGVYNVLATGTINESDGLVNNLGGGTFNMDEGETQWVRLGYIEMSYESSGAVTFILGYDLPPAPPGTTNGLFAEVGGGTIAWADINFTGTPATVPEPASLCLLAVGGVFALRRRRRKSQV